MYGLLSLPRNSSKDERIEYRKHMCSLCDSLHENYGVKARFLTNYDLTTISVIATALDESLLKQLPDANKIFCTRFLSYNKPKEIFTFFSAISVMLAYCKKFDNCCENQDNCPSINFEKEIKISENILFKYGLDKKYFESKIQTQHNYEINSLDIETLSKPTSEMISQILTIVCKILNKENQISKIQELGREIGKLVYVYDGILDYQKDMKDGAFNCINRCFIKNEIPSPYIADNITNFISSTKDNVIRIIDEIKFPNGSSLIKLVLLQDISIYEKSQGNIIRKIIKKNSSTQLNRQIIYSIISGNLLINNVAADSGSSCGCPLGDCGACIGLIIFCICCFPTMDKLGLCGE